MQSPLSLAVKPLSSTPSCQPTRNVSDPTILGLALAPKLQYYLCRDNGTHVPLIPADELPHDFRLHGVSRTIDPEQARARGMIFLGAQRATGRTFVPEHSLRSSDLARVPAAEPVAAPSAEQFRAPDALVKVGAPAKQFPVVCENAVQAIDDFETIAEANTEVQARLFAGASVNFPIQRPLPPSGIEPDESKKVYCTHWIRNGECDFLQQGCKYKHVMPDEEGLAKIGIKGTPRWWLILHPSPPQQQSKWTRYSGPGAATWFKKSPQATVKQKELLTLTNRCTTESDTSESDRRSPSKQQHLLKKPSTTRHTSRTLYTPSLPKQPSTSTSLINSVYASRHAIPDPTTTSPIPLSLATSRHAPTPATATRPVSPTTGDLISFDITRPNSPLESSPCPSTATVSSGSTVAEEFEAVMPPKGAAAAVAVNDGGAGKGVEKAGGLGERKGRKVGGVGAGVGHGVRKGAKGRKGAVVVKQGKVEKVEVAEVVGVAEMKPVEVAVVPAILE